MLGLIIWGRKGVTSVAGAGTFDCPGCGPGKSYEHKKVTKYFTLYFIPLIPMGTHGEYVECQSCRKNWKPTVLPGG